MTTETADDSFLPSFLPSPEPAIQAGKEEKPKRNYVYNGGAFGSIYFTEGNSRVSTIVISLGHRVGAATCEGVAAALQRAYDAGVQDGKGE